MSNIKFQANCQVKEEPKKEEPKKVVVKPPLKNTAPVADDTYNKDSESDDPVQESPDTSVAEKGNNSKTLVIALGAGAGVLVLLLIIVTVLLARKGKQTQ